MKSGPSNAIVTRDGETGNEVKSIRSENPNLSYSAFQMSSDLRWLWAMDTKRVISVWEFAAGRLLPALGPVESANISVFSPDGRVIVATDFDAITVWETASGRARARIALPAAALQAISRPREAKASVDASRSIQPLGITRDHRLVLVGTVAGELVVFDVWEGKEIKRVKAHRAVIRDIRFAAKGNQFLTTSDDGIALAWDANLFAIGLPAKPLPAENVRQWITDLGMIDAAKASAAIQCLTLYPDATIKQIRSLPRPLTDETAVRIRELIAQLDHPRFKLREEAGNELTRYGVVARGELEAAVKRAPSEDARVRMEKLLHRIDDKIAIQSLREFRIIETLERIGTPEARKLLADLVKGAEESPILREAKAVLSRFPQ